MTFDQDAVIACADLVGRTGATAERYRRLARRTLNAVAPEIERQVRERVAAEIEALRDGVANPDKPYNEAFTHALDCAIRAVLDRAEGT